MFVQAEFNKFPRDKKNYRIGSDRTERIPLGGWGERERERKKIPKDLLTAGSCSVFCGPAKLYGLSSLQGVRAKIR